MKLKVLKLKLKDSPKLTLCAYLDGLLINKFVCNQLVDEKFGFIQDGINIGWAVIPEGVAQETLIRYFAKISLTDVPSKTWRNGDGGEHDVRLNMTKYKVTRTGNSKMLAADRSSARQTPRQQAQSLLAASRASR